MDRPMSPSGILDFKYFFNDWMIGSWEVQICKVITHLCRKGSPETLLDHVHMQKVDLAKDNGPQRHPSDRLHAGSLPAAFVVNPFNPLGSVNLEVISLFIMPDCR